MQLAQAIDSWLETHGANLSASTKRDIAHIRESVIETGWSELPCTEVDRSIREDIIEEATTGGTLGGSAIGEFLTVVLGWGGAQTVSPADAIPVDDGLGPSGAFHDDDDSDDDEDPDEDDDDDEEEDSEDDDEEDSDDSDDDEDPDADEDDHEVDEDYDADDDEDPDADDDEDEEDDDDSDDDDSEYSYDDEDPDDDDEDDDDSDDEDSEDDDADDDDSDEDDSDDEDSEDDDDGDEDSEDGDEDSDDEDDDDDSDTDGVATEPDPDDWVGILREGDDGFEGLAPEGEPPPAEPEVDEKAAASSFFDAIGNSEATELDREPIITLDDAADEQPKGGVFSAAAEHIPPKPASGIDWITVAYFTVAAVCFALVIFLYLSS